MFKAVVAIGGGRIRTRQTLAIDREIIRLSCKKHPRLLFIPTASSDDRPYCRIGREYFGGLLKCAVDVLLLLKGRPSREVIRRKIAAADIIYVGGGNTLMMMRVWRRLGVDKLLKSAYNRGTILCGVSAGSICWFDSGHSDSMFFYNPRRWKYVKVKGLGLIEGIHCPHYNGSTGRIPRKRHFKETILKTGGIGIAIENNCAIEFIESGNRRLYRVLRSKRNARAYRVYKSGNDLVAGEIPCVRELTPLGQIYARISSQGRVRR